MQGTTENTSQNMGRGVRAMLVVGLHAVVIYAIATALGIVHAPSLIKPMEAVFIDASVSTHQEKPLAAKPQMVQPNLDVQVPDPTPQIDEPVEAAVAPPDSSEAISDANLQVTRRVDPDYPSASRRAGEQGTAVFAVLVDPSGHPQDVKVQTSSGHERLDQAGMQAIHRWIFNPAVRDSQKVTAWTTVRVTFQLQNG
jgi:protein TonB